MKSGDKTRFTFRIAPKLLAALKRKARENNRSVNAEIEFILKTLVQA